MAPSSLPMPPMTEPPPPLRMPSMPPYSQPPPPGVFPMTSKPESHVCLNRRALINLPRTPLTCSFVCWRPCIGPAHLIYDGNSEAGVILLLLLSEFPPSGQCFFFLSVVSLFHWFNRAFYFPITWATFWLATLAWAFVSPRTPTVGNLWDWHPQPPINHHVFSTNWTTWCGAASYSSSSFASTSSFLFRICVTSPPVCPVGM